MMIVMAVILWVVAFVLGLIVLFFGALGNNAKVAVLGLSIAIFAFGYGLGMATVKLAS